MKKGYIIPVFACCVLFSCSKKIKSEGTVYSRRGQAIPNIIIQLNNYGSSAYPNSTAQTTTNASGHFVFNASVTKEIH